MQSEQPSSSGLPNTSLEKQKQEGSSVPHIEEKKKSKKRTTSETSEKSSPYFMFMLISSIMGGVLGVVGGVCSNLSGHSILKQAGQTFFWDQSLEPLNDLLSMSVTGGASMGVLIGLMLGCYWAYLEDNKTSKNTKTLSTPQAITAAIVLISVWVAGLPLITLRGVTAEDASKYLELLQANAVGTTLLLGVFALLATAYNADKIIPLIPSPFNCCRFQAPKPSSGSKSTDNPEAPSGPQNVTLETNQEAKYQILT